MFDELLTVEIADHLASGSFRHGAGFHTSPEGVPVLAARAEGTVAVDVNPLAAEGLAEEGVVEGGLAGHFVVEEGFGGDWGLGGWAFSW